MVGILKEKEPIVIFKVNVIDILSINIYINCHMIFGDEETFQQQLFADIDSLLKIIKCEQQHYAEVNEVLNNIFINKQELETNLFVDNDVAGYRRLVKDIQLRQKGYCQQKKRIAERYQNIESVQQSMVVLLKRVVYRVLEIVFSSISQLSFKSTHSHHDYIRFKQICHKLLPQQNAQYPFKVFRCINDYTANKLNRSLASLTIVADNLENGKIEQIDKLKLTSALDIIQNREVNAKTSKSSILENGQKIKCRIKYNYPFFKEQAKFNDKDRAILKKKTKKVLLEAIRDVVQIKRQDFLQDSIDYCKQDNKEKLFKALMAKNKHNQKQITEYLAKKIHRRKVPCLIQAAPGVPKSEQSTKPEMQKGEDLVQTTCRTTRKSLLLKTKENQLRQRQESIASQFYRKITKLQEIRSKIRTNSNAQLKKLPAQNVAIYKTIDQVITGNQELALKVREENTNKQRLPLLYKRAQSVDQYYKAAQPEAKGRAKGLSSSAKLGGELKNKLKVDKTEILPSKIKIELKGLNNLINNEIHKKLSKYDFFNKKMCF